MIDPGELDQKITIQQRVETRREGSGGGYDVSWVQLARVWAKPRPMRGSERLHADQVEGRALYRFTIRRRGDVTEDMQIVWNGAEWNIRFIGDAGGRDKFMNIEAERGVAT